VSKLLAQSHTLGVPITFGGYIPNADLPHLYRLASVTCAPSVWDEPFGLVALESVACGCPVVVSDRGGLSEAAGPGGLVAQLGKDGPRGIAGAIESVLLDDTVRSSLVEHGLRFAAQQRWETSMGHLLGSVGQ
jgi:glycogen synthase